MSPFLAWGEWLELLQPVSPPVERALPASLTMNGDQRACFHCSQSQHAEGSKLLYYFLTLLEKLSTNRAASTTGGYSLTLSEVIGLTGLRSRCLRAASSRKARGRICFLPDSGGRQDPLAPGPFLHHSILCSLTVSPLPSF